MHRATARFAITLIACAAGLGAEDANEAGLKLRLTDGTRIHATQIAGANTEALTVVSSTDNIRIERTLPWTRITAAELAGQSYSVRELKLSLDLPPHREFVIPTSDWIPSTLAFAPPHGPCTEYLPFSGHYLPPGRVIGIRPDPAAAYADIASALYPNGIPATETPFALGLLRERRRLEAITPFVNPVGFTPAVPAFPPPPVGIDATGPLSQIEARVTPIRRNGAADINALGIELIGFDEAGSPVPVQGTAQITLYALRQRLIPAFGQAFAAQPEKLTQLAEWTRQISSDASVIIRLPEPLPDHDPTISPIGSIRVRLNMPGAGVFESLTEPVTLRAPSLTRDAVRAESAARFLSDEKTSGNRLQTWPRSPDLSSLD